MANIYSSGNPKDELRQQVAPGSTDATLADGLRSGSGIIVLTGAQFAAVQIKDSRAIYIVDGAILTNQGPQPLSISGAPSELIKGQSYTFTPIISGGQGTRFYSIRGSLPQGLSFNSSTGEITGNPTSGASLRDVYIEVKDDTGRATLGPLVFAPSSAIIEVARPLTAIGNASQRVINGINYQTQSQVGKLYQIQKFNDFDEYRFELRDGDTWAGDVSASPPRNRAEFQQLTTVPTTPGTDIWFSDTIAIDSNEDSQANWVILNQMHYGFSGLNAVLFYELIGSTLYIRTAWDDTTDSSNGRLETQATIANFPRKKFVRFVTRLRFGINGTAQLYVWQDGAPIVQRDSTNIGYVNDSRWAPYWKFGAYRRASTQTFAVRHVNVEGAQTTSLAARINNPLPLPASEDLSLPAAGVAPITSTILESFDSDVGYTLSSASALTLSVDTSRVAQGSAALRFQGRGTTGQVFATKLAIANGDPATMTGGAVRFDTGWDADYQTSASVDVRIGRGGSYYSVGSGTGLSEVTLGPRYITISPSKITTLKDIGPGQLDGRFYTSFARHSGGSVSFDGLFVNPSNKGKVVYVWDDGRENLHTKCFPLFQQFGLKFGFHVPWELIGQTYANSENRVTLDNIKEWANYGASMMLNGTRDDTSMTSRTDLATVLAELRLGQQYLRDNNLTGIGDNMYVYPNGDHQIPGNKVSLTTVITTAGSNIVTMSTTAGILQGYRACGIQVTQEPRVRVNTVDSGTQVTLSANATLTGTFPMDFVDDSGPFHTGKLPKYLADNGFVYGRSAGTGIGLPSYYEGGGLGRRMLWPNMSISNNFALEGASGTNTIKGRILQAAEEKTTLVILLHGLTEDADTLLTASRAKITEMLRFTREQMDLGQIENPSPHEWRNAEFGRTYPVV